MVNMRACMISLVRNVSRTFGRHGVLGVGDARPNICKSWRDGKAGCDELLCRCKGRPGSATE